MSPAEGPSEASFQTPEGKKPLVKIWSHYNTGFFDDMRHSELDRGKRPELNSIEHVITNAVVSYLKHQKGPVNVLDLGGMYAASLVVIGSLFDGHIRAGRLRLFSTSQEPDFTIDNLLSEAIRRNAEADRYSRLKKIPMAGKTHREQIKLSVARGNSSPVFSPGELDFYKLNHHRVTYLSGVDTHTLPGIAEQYCPGGKFTIIHEHYGGLEHAHEDTMGAAQAVIQSLAPDGLILSHAFHRFFEQPEDLDVWVPTGTLWKVNTHSAQRHEYWALTLPGCPVQPVDFQ